MKILLGLAVAAASWGQIADPTQNGASLLIGARAGQHFGSTILARPVDRGSFMVRT